MDFGLKMFRWSYLKFRNRVSWVKICRTGWTAHCHGWPSGYPRRLFSEIDAESTELGKKKKKTKKTTTLPFTCQTNTDALKRKQINLIRGESSLMKLVFISQWKINGPRKKPHKTPLLSTYQTKHVFRHLELEAVQRHLRRGKFS